MENKKKKIALGVLAVLVLGGLVTSALMLRQGSVLKGQLGGQNGQPYIAVEEQGPFDVAESSAMTVHFYVPDDFVKGNISLVNKDDPSKIVSFFELEKGQNDYPNFVNGPMTVEVDDAKEYFFHYTLPAVYQDESPIVSGPDEKVLLMFTFSFETAGMGLNPPLNSEGFGVINTLSQPKINALPDTVDLLENNLINVTFGVPQNAVSATIELYPESDPTRKVKTFELTYADKKPTFVKEEDAKIELKDQGNGTYLFTYEIPNLALDKKPLESGKYVFTLAYTTSLQALIPPLTSLPIMVKVPEVNNDDTAVIPLENITLPDNKVTPPEENKNHSVVYVEAPNTHSSPPSTVTPPTDTKPSVVKPTPPVTAPKKEETPAPELNCGGFIDSEKLTEEECRLGELMKEKGIFTSHTFRPKEKVKRYEAALLVTRTFNLNSKCVAGILNTYVDIDFKAPYFEELCAAKSAGVVKGYEQDPENPVLLPSKEVSFREFSRMVTNGYIASQKGKAPRTYDAVARELGFEVSEPNNWFGYAFQFWFNHNLTTVDEMKTIDFDMGMSRFQIAKFLSRTLEDLK